MKSPVKSGLFQFLEPDAPGKYRHLAAEPSSNRRGKFGEFVPAMFTDAGTIAALSVLDLFDCQLDRSKMEVSLLRTSASA